MADLSPERNANSVFAQKQKIIPNQFMEIINDGNRASALSNDYFYPSNRYSVNTKIQASFGLWAEMFQHLAASGVYIFTYREYF